MKPLKVNWEPYLAKFSQRDIDEYLMAVDLIEAGNGRIALPILHRLAAIEFDPAIHTLAHCQEQGHGGIARDTTAAIENYKRAARLGNPASLNDLGVFSFNGIHTEKNLPGALSLFAAAAKKGSLPAIHCMACMLDLGLGTAPDGARALELYQLADSHGYTYSTNALGVYFACGRHTEPNKAKATHYFRRAAEDGDQDAQLNLDRIQSISRTLSPMDEMKELRRFGKLWLQDFPF